MSDCIGIFCGVMIIGFLVGLVVMDGWNKSKAVKAKAAYYECDPATGKVQFKYGRKGE